MEGGILAAVALDSVCSAAAVVVVVAVPAAVKRQGTAGTAAVVVELGQHALMSPLVVSWLELVQK